MPISISFGGSGRHFPFMLGVARELKTSFDLDWSKIPIHCCSSGSAGAMALALCSPEQIDQMVAKGIYANTKGYSILDIMKYMIPADSYRRIGDNIWFGQSLIYPMRPHLYRGPFQSQSELLETVVNSCRIPWLTAEFHSILDGGFSHKYAIVDDLTLIISLKPKSYADITAKRRLPLEFIRPSKDKMFALYQEGRNAVAEKLDLIKMKFELASETSLALNYKFHPR